jgi:hypothetical protein
VVDIPLTNTLVAILFVSDAVIGGAAPRESSVRSPYRGETFNEAPTPEGVTLVQTAVILSQPERRDASASQVRTIVHTDTARAGEALVNQRPADVTLSRGRFDAERQGEARSVRSVETPHTGPRSSRQRRYHITPSCCPLMKPPRHMERRERLQGEQGNDYAVCRQTAYTSRKAKSAVPVPVAVQPCSSSNALFTMLAVRSSPVTLVISYVCV